MTMNYYLKSIDFDFFFSRHRKLTWSMIASQGEYIEAVVLRFSYAWVARTFWTTWYVPYYSKQYLNCFLIEMTTMKKFNWIKDVYIILIGLIIFLVLIWNFYYFGRSSTESNWKQYHSEKKTKLLNIRQ